MVVRRINKIDFLKQDLSNSKTYWHKLLDERSDLGRHRCHILVQALNIISVTLASYPSGFIANYRRLFKGFYAHAISTKNSYAGPFIIVLFTGL